MSRSQRKQTGEIYVEAALKARDPAAVRAAMREHFHRLIEAMLEASERRALEEV